MFGYTLKSECVDVSLWFTSFASFACVFCVECCSNSSKAVVIGVLENRNHQVVVVVVSFHHHELRRTCFTYLTSYKGAERKLSSCCSSHTCKRVGRRLYCDPTSSPLLGESTFLPSFRMIPFCESFLLKRILPSLRVVFLFCILP